jgi:hypothetical protein
MGLWDHPWAELGNENTMNLDEDVSNSHLANLNLDLRKDRKMRRRNDQMARRMRRGEEGGRRVSSNNTGGTIDELPVRDDSFNSLQDDVGEGKRDRRRLIRARNAKPCE